ncbi:hypothetical protein QQX98_009194 [Neonectria punicea]|uniref:Alpha/beta hydrolase fold-3 domain-containing protein n=1 Tax=Neonectria punicea TaxID=979145 RepID=A0ABR1GT08_9HYPO
MAQDGRKIWQPIPTETRPKLDPEYVAFHDQYMQYVQPDDLKVWDGTARTQPSLPPGGTPPVPVGSTRDFCVGEFQLRAYTPTGESEANGWPVLIWFHGGGWAIGGLNDNKDFCTFVCQVSLLLIVPVIDNTATTEGVWKRNAVTAPWLTPARMEWYRKLYFTNPEDREQWDASPNFAPESLLKRLPRTWMAVSDQDILAPEAESFAEQLKGLGVEVEVVTIEGGTHSILSLSGKVARGKRMVQDAANHLKLVFGS